MTEEVEFHAKKLWEAQREEEVHKHIKALCEIGTPKAVEVLAKALEHKSSLVAYWSAEALGEMGDKRAVNPLIKSLERKNSERIFRSAYVLGKLGDKKALPALMKLSGHRHEAIDDMVKKAIKQIQEANDG